MLWTIIFAIFLVLNVAIVLWDYASRKFTMLTLVNIGGALSCVYFLMVVNGRAS